MTPASFTNSPSAGKRLAEPLAAAPRLHAGRVIFAALSRVDRLGLCPRPRDIFTKKKEGAVAEAVIDLLVTKEGGPA